MAGNKLVLNPSRSLSKALGTLTNAAQQIEDFLAAFGGYWPPRPSYEWPICFDGYHDIWEMAVDEFHRMSNPDNFRRWMRQELKEKIHTEAVLEALRPHLWLHDPIMVGLQGCLQYLVNFYRWGSCPPTQEEKDRETLEFPEELWVPFTMFHDKISVDNKQLQRWNPLVHTQSTFLPSKQSISFYSKSRTLEYDLSRMVIHNNIQLTLTEHGRFLFGVTPGSSLLNLSFAAAEYDSTDQVPTSMHYHWSTDPDILYAETNFFLSFAFIDNACTPSLKVIRDYLVVTHAASLDKGKAKAVLTARVELLKDLRNTVLQLNKDYLKRFSKPAVALEVFEDNVLSMATWGLQGKEGATGTELLYFYLLQAFLSTTPSEAEDIGHSVDRVLPSRCCQLLEVLATEQRETRFDSFLGLAPESDPLLEAREELVQSLFMWQLGQDRASVESQGISTTHTFNIKEAVDRWTRPLCNCVLKITCMNRNTAE